MVDLSSLKVIATELALVQAELVLEAEVGVILVADVEVEVEVVLYVVDAAFDPDAVFS